MTKAKTVAARRRQRRRKISLPGGEVAMAPATQGMREPQQDARQVALEARVRVYGMASVATPPDQCPTKEQLEAIKKKAHSKALGNATSPLAGSDIGQCIIALHPAQARQAEIWQTWQALGSACRTYGLRIIGQTGEPKGAAIAIVPDAMQTDDRHSVDVRTADERDRDAKRAHAHWQARLKALPAPQLLWAIRTALTGGMGASLWQDGAPTATGRNAVAALVILTDGRT